MPFQPEADSIKTTRGRPFDVRFNLKQIMPFSRVEHMIKLYPSRVLHANEGSLASYPPQGGADASNPPPTVRGHVGVTAPPLLPTYRR